MSVGTAFLRIFFSLLLALPFMVALTYYLFVLAAQPFLQDPGLVSNSVRTSGFYDGIYRGAFLRSEFKPWTDSFIGGFEVSNEDRAQLVEDIAPKAYIQGETERNISHLLTYLDSAEDDLDPYVDLNTPLRNSPPVTTNFVDRKVQALPSVEVSSPEELADETAIYLQSLGSGRLPDHLPTSEGVAVEQRVQAYQDAIATLDEAESVPGPIAESLSQSESEAIELIQASDLEGALAKSGRSVASERAALAQGFVLDRSDPQRRLHLVDQIAENSNLTTQRILNDAGLLRSILQAATSTAAQWIALAIAALSLLGIGLLFVPYWKHTVFWPSMALVLSGTVLLVLALATTVDISYWTSLFCKEGDIARCALTLGVVREMAIGIGGGIADSALKVILIGSIGLVLAFVVARAVPQRAS